MTRTLTHSDLRQFIGDLQRFRHPLNPHVLYTPGIQYLAEAGGAYWLIDEIALALGSREMQMQIALDPRAGDMQFWSLRVRDDQSASLVCEVDQDQPILTKRIAFTYFPLDRADIWAGFDGRRWTLYLPSEH